jgi:hypothetical protein
MIVNDGAVRSFEPFDDLPFVECVRRNEASSLDRTLPLNIHPGVTAVPKAPACGRMTLAVCSFSILQGCGAKFGVTPLDLLSCG